MNKIVEIVGVHIYNVYMVSMKVSYNETFLEKNKEKSYLFNAATIRYLSCSGFYVIRGYCESLERIADIKISEYDLLCVINEKKDYIEELDDSSYDDLMILKEVFCISASVMKQAQKQWHKKRLGRCLTSVVGLKRKVEKRKRAGEGIVSQNIEDFDRIYENCIKNDRYSMYEMLIKEWCRYKGMPYNKKQWVEKYRKAREELATSGVLNIYK